MKNNFKIGDKFVYNENWYNKKDTNPIYVYGVVNTIKVHNNEIFVINDKYLIEGCRKPTVDKEKSYFN